MAKDDIVSKYQDGVFGFPSHDIPPEEKEHDWHLQFSEAIYAEYVKDQAFPVYSKRDEIIENRAYGSGRQDPSRYVKIIRGESELPGESEKEYANLDHRIVSPASKFKQAVIGKMMAIDHNISAIAVDPVSSREKDQKKWSLWAQKQYGQKINKLKSQLGLATQEPEFVPDTLSELDLFMSVSGIKLKQEIMAEQLLDYSFYMSQWKNDVKPKLIADLFENAFAGVKDYIDPEDGKVKGRYVDIANCIAEYSRRSDFKNSRYAAELIWMTPVELREYGFTEEEIKGMSKNFNGSYGNPYIDNWYGDMDHNRGYVYDNFKIPVLDSAYFSINKEYVTTRKTKYGEKSYKEDFGKIKNSEKRKTEVKEIKVVYKSKWVVGTQKVFDYGILENTPRPGLKDARLPFHFVRINDKSKIDLIKPNLDQIQLVWLKLQNAIAKSAPSGLMVEWNSLQNMNLGSEKLKPIHLLTIRRLTGDIVYKATTHKGVVNSPHSMKPIHETEGGIGRQLQEFIQILEYNFNMIGEVIGISRVAAASDPNPRESAAATKEAVSSTHDTLKSIYDSYITMKENISINFIERVKDIVSRDDSEDYAGYFPAIGKPSLEMMRVTKDISLKEYGIKIKARPDQYKIQEIRQSALNALNSGKNGKPSITYSDYHMIVKMAESGMDDWASAYLSYREQKAFERDRLMQQENMQMNSQIQMQAEQSKLEAEKVKIAAEADAEIAVEREKARLRMLEKFYDKEDRIDMMLVEKQIEGEDAKVN